MHTRVIRSTQTNTHIIRPLVEELCSLAGSECPRSSTEAAVGPRVSPLLHRVGGGGGEFSLCPLTTLQALRGHCPTPAPGEKERVFKLSYEEHYHSLMIIPMGH